MKTALRLRLRIVTSRDWTVREMNRAKQHDQVIGTPLGIEFKICVSFLPEAKVLSCATLHFVNFTHS